MKITKCKLADGACSGHLRALPLQFAICILQFAFCNSFLMLSPIARAEGPSLKENERTLTAAHVGTEGKDLLKFFRDRTPTAADQARIADQVTRLGATAYKVRQQALASLVARGRVAIPALKRARASPDLEVARRAEQALRRIQDRDAGPGLTAAAARVLAARKPDGAAATLLAFLPFAEDELSSGEVLTALSALAGKGGKPDPALTAALTDPHPLRRAAAAEALCRAKVEAARPAVRRLLRDADPVVRFRAAAALAGAGEKDAVPVVIDLLTHLPPAQAYLAQDFLFRIGLEKSPSAPLGLDDESRKQCRDVWTAWWQEHGAKTDLARLARPHKPKGYTMLVLIDAGKVVERDAAGKQRWEVGDLQLPVDVEILPGERLLITEHGAGRVTERTTKGRLLWEKKIAQPLMAQRLPGGNTFIATRTNLVEVDRAGKEVASINPPNGGLLMRARRLRNGQIACITMDRGLGETHFFLLDPAGKPLRSFPVNVTTYGGRLEMLGPDRFLVPEMGTNQLLAYNLRGKVVWEARVKQPVAAVALPNGHVLVTTYSEHRALELDEDGMEVGEYRADSRVTRAWRR